MTSDYIIMFLYYDLCHVQVPYGGMIAHWNVCMCMCVHVHTYVCMYVYMYTSNIHSTHGKKAITGMLNFVK